MTPVLILATAGVIALGIIANTAPGLLRAWADYRLAQRTLIDPLDALTYSQRQVAGIILATVYRAAEPGLDDHLREELAQTIAEDLDAGLLQVPERPSGDA